ncbi:MAG: HAD family hydrolase [Bacteroidia bacterium]
MSGVKYIFFDAANTLIHKPALWPKLQEQLKKHGFDVPENMLRRNHKLLSESIRFPDRTSKDFYLGFNAELLYSLGISPGNQLLEDIFASCTYLSWEPFSDTKIIGSLPVPAGVLSNFNSSLKNTIGGMFGDAFKKIIISEDHGIAKPHPDFFRLAVEASGVKADEILFIGDSIRLDMEPAEKAGMKKLLIDRDDVYPLYRDRITSLDELIVYLQNSAPSV